MAEILPFPKKAVQGKKETAPGSTEPEALQGAKVDPVSSGTSSQEKCPICQKTTQKKYSPFCSSRCWQVDLGRWLNGSYRVETDEQPLDGQPAPEDQEGW